MIVGIVALTSDSIKSTVNEIMSSAQTRIKVVTDNDMLPYIGLGDIVNNTDLKCTILAMLEEHYGSIIVHGNVFLDRDVAEWINTHGGSTIVIQDSEVSWDNPILKKLDTQGVISFFQKKWKGVGRSIDSLPRRLEGVTSDMTVEDIIKQAREKLGLPTESAQPMKEEPTVEEPASTENIEKPAVQDIPVNTVYFKLVDGSIALFIPQENIASLPVQTIEGKSWITLSFKAPDLGNTQLQGLKILNAMDFVPNPDGDLLSMVKEKIRLDNLIKEARAKGDNELVLELRRKRHALRDKINKYGGSNG